MDIPYLAVILIRVVICHNLKEMSGVYRYPMEYHRCIPMTIFLFVVVIFVVYLEEWYTIDLIESECTVVNHKTDYQETCNGDAKKTCKGKEKCLKIFVSFKDHDWNDRMAKLFFSEEYLSENDECSFSECETRMKEESTENDYFDFRNTYTKTGTTFRCFYHPKNEQAVLSRKHKRKVAWKAIVIPIIYFVIEICLYSRKRQNTRPTDIVTPL